MTREIILITGKTGSGKSTLFRDLILKQERFIIFDTLSEYRALPLPFPALFITDIPSLIDYLIRNSHNKIRIIFDPEDPDREITLKTGETMTVFEAACKMVSEGLTDVVLGVEEIANYVSPSYAPAYLRRIVRFGRHSSISLYATTQRPPEIPPVIRSQLTKFVSFKQHEPRDLEYIAKATSRDFADRLKGLGLYKYIVYDFKGKIYESI